MPDAVTGTSSPTTGIPTTATTPTTGFNSVTGAGGTIKTDAKPGGDLGKDAFLKLLVAQLKYQNPLSPTNPDQFMAQTAQFTMVEKLEEISKAQTDLTVWQKVTAGQALVGRQVAGKSDLGADVTGVVTGLTLGSDGPRLLLSDGSTMAVTSVTSVTAPGATLPGRTSPVPNGSTPASAPATASTPATTTTAASPPARTEDSPATATEPTPAATPTSPATDDPGGDVPVPVSGTADTASAA